MPCYQPQASISHPVNFYEQLTCWGTGRVLALGAAKFQSLGLWIREGWARASFLVLSTFTYPSVKPWGCTLIFPRSLVVNSLSLFQNSPTFPVLLKASAAPWEKAPTVDTQPLATEVSSLQD